MSHLNPGLISAYNSLTDKHLAGYFSNTRIRRHLQRAGLITRSGRIVPDKEYRHKVIQRAHQRHVRECLAQAIFHKVLEMERLHQIEIKRKLEEFSRREQVHKIKVERAKRCEEDIIHILSPRPPMGLRGNRRQRHGPEGEHSESSESPGSSRPNTAPGKMQRPVRLKPIHSNSTTASLRRTPPHKLLESSNEKDQLFNCTMDKESRRQLTTMGASCGISPYCLPVINNFVTPVPPATKRKERGVKVTPSGTLRGRRLRPTTASSGADDPPMLRSAVHQSRVWVNMVYFGKMLHLSQVLTDTRDEIKVFQQHCGGENLCVYKGKLHKGETFQFISRRHRGFPFSLTFFLNGLLVERLSSCCEFKHRKGSRLGGRHGHFGFSSVEGASPCYKCIIALGLDKKPTPPPKRVKEDGGREESVISQRDAPEMETERTGEDTASHSDCEMSQRQDTETQVKEETAAEEDKVREDYEEDFEADDEGPAEEAKEKKSSSPSSETETQVKERDASETEEDEKDEDIKSCSGSSCTGSDQEASDTEATKDSREDEKAEQPQEADREETVVPADKEEDPNPEETAATEAKSAVAKDSDLQDSAGDSTEIDISDSSVPSGTENKLSDTTSGEKDAEKMVDEGKEEEEQEQGRAKSVQEKLAEAILKESRCSSEPELSDTSTEEEEEATDKGHGQNNNDVVPEKSMEFTKQSLTDEMKCKESVGKAEVVLDKGETLEAKEQEDETEKEPHDSDSTKDETVKIDEDDEKPAFEEEIAEKDESEATGAAFPPVLEENMTEENKTSEPQEDAAAKTADADGGQKGDENEKTAEVEEADIQSNETGQAAGSSEEHESLVSEPNKKTDETAVSDNAEAMTANQTMEMKAESLEEREALSCEEASVTNTEEMQRGDSKDRTKVSETEVTAENISSLMEGGGDTTAEKTANISEDNAEDEGSKNDIREEEAEEVSAAEASKDGNHVEGLGEEQTEKSVEIDDEVEKEKSEEGSKEEEKQKIPDETPEGENGEEKQRNETDKTEEEENDERKIGERIDNEENTAEDPKTDTNTEIQTNEEPTEKTIDGDNKVGNEKRADESQKTEKDENSVSVETKNDDEESEGMEAITDKTNEGEEITESKTDADEEKGDKAEKEAEDDNQSESEKNKDDKETEDKKIITCKTGEEEEISAIIEEPEKNADDTKISKENTDESEDVGDSEAANGTKEMLNNTMESEDVKKKTGGASTSNEKGESDTENGEISTGAERKTAEHVEDERGTEKELNEDESSEVKEEIMESGDDAEKHEDVKVDQAPDRDMVENEAEEEGDSVKNQDENAQKVSEQEAFGTEIKEESNPDNLNKGREDSGDTKQEENEQKSDPDNKNRASDSTRNNDNNVDEVVIASLADQAKLSKPIDFVFGGLNLDETAAMSLSHPHSFEDVAAVDLSTVNGEYGAETEEVSKASEEGASVLLKPEAQRLSEADNMEESVAIGKETPEALAGEENTDLVTNWITKHQTSKFFETFVEPLEDLREEVSQNQVSISREEAKSTELLRSEGPLKMVTMSENEKKELMEEDENEDGEKNKVKSVALDLESKHSGDGDPDEDDPAKDTYQEEEETEVKDLVPKTETEENEKESKNGRSEGSRGSLQEDEIQERPTQMQNETSTTEVESITGTHHLVASDKPESVIENQTGEKTTDNDSDLNEKQTETEKIKGLPPSSKTEEHWERSVSPGELKNTAEQWGKTDEQSREETEITDFTISNSEDGSQEESQNGEIQPKPCDGRISGEREDVQLIQDIKHTLSKEQQSTLSVDETLFGHSSYPLLTAARTESGH